MFIMRPLMRIIPKWGWIFRAVFFLGVRSPWFRLWDCCEHFTIITDSFACHFLTYKAILQKFHFNLLAKIDYYFPLYWTLDLVIIYNKKSVWSLHLILWTVVVNFACSNADTFFTVFSHTFMILITCFTYKFKYSFEYLFIVL